jgi:hypothetical protein
MYSLAFRAPLRKHYSSSVEASQPNFESPAAPQGPLTAAGLHLFRRHHIRPELADLLAAANGLGGEQVLRL